MPHLGVALHRGLDRRDPCPLLRPWIRFGSGLPIDRSCITPRHLAGSGHLIRDCFEYTETEHAMRVGFSLNPFMIQHQVMSNLICLCLHTHLAMLPRRTRRDCSKKTSNLRGGWSEEGTRGSESTRSKERRVSQLYPRILSEENERLLPHIVDRRARWTSLERKQAVHDYSGYYSEYMQVFGCIVEYGKPDILAYAITCEQVQNPLLGLQNLYPSVRFRSPPPITPSM